MVNKKKSLKNYKKHCQLLSTTNFYELVITFYFSSIKVELYLGLPDLVDTDKSSADPDSEATPPPPCPSFSLVCPARSWANSEASSALRWVRLELLETFLEQDKTMMMKISRRNLCCIAPSLINTNPRHR